MLRWTLRRRVQLLSARRDLAMPIESERYQEYLASRASCGSCHWTGLAAYLRTGEGAHWGMEKFCPRCGAFVAYAPWSVGAPRSATLASTERRRSTMRADVVRGGDGENPVSAPWPAQLTKVGGSVTSGW